ncbi:MAG: secreted protein with Fibrobacter succinoprotein major domain [Parcubacteria group bacterium Athens0714_24]|nr:MAG: secreted protein with Fibrobacter succinoprotein major domain [Parcubacteria group bacterium Athens0714_24]
MFGRTVKFFLILILIFGWLFSGWPRVWQNPPVPPEIKEAYADTSIFAENCNSATARALNLSTGTSTGMIWSSAITLYESPSQTIRSGTTLCGSSADAAGGVGYTMNAPLPTTNVYYADYYWSENGTIANSDSIGVLLNYIDANNYYACQMEDDATPEVTIIKVSGGVGSTLVRQVNKTIDTGDHVKCTIDYSNTNPTITFTNVTDSAALATVTDSSSPLTETKKAGVFCGATPGDFTGDTCDNNLWFDNMALFTVPAVAPTVTTTNPPANPYDQTTATLLGNISATGGGKITGRGFAYGTVANLSTVIATTTDWGSWGTGDFTKDVSSLTCNTPYYVRAYAQNSAGTSTGAIYNFTTSACNTAPTLTVSTPPLEGASVTVGDNYNITYTLSDAEEVVTAKFFYDTNGSGLDGAAISGCETKGEGETTCVWNTTGMTPDNYYVYATTTDGIASEVNDYSPGVLTINAAASLTLIVDTDNFSSLTPGTPRFATSTVSVDTNKSTGWYVTLERQDADTTLDLDSDATINITDQTVWTAPSATNTHTGASSVQINSFDNSQRVLAFRVMTASSTNGSMFFAPSWWGSADNYTDNVNTLWAGIPAPSSNQKIGISSVSSGGSPALNTVLYYLDVPNTQKTGAYSGNIIFTAVMND